MIIIGLTGNIACGKSEVGEMLRELGAGIIDADEVARAVVEPGTDARDDIVGEFGEKILGPGGRIDRKKLGDIVFNNAESRQKLNEIVHPRIRERISLELEKLRKDGKAAAVIEAALIVENGGWLYEITGSLIVVTADRETQIERLTARNGYTREEAISRINSQMPPEEKISHADYVIDNSGPLAETRRRVTEVWRQINTQAGRERPGIP